MFPHLNLTKFSRNLTKYIHILGLSRVGSILLLVQRRPGGGFQRTSRHPSTSGVSSTLSACCGRRRVTVTGRVSSTTRVTCRLSSSARASRSSPSRWSVWSSPSWSAAGRPHALTAPKRRRPTRQVSAPSAAARRPRRGQRRRNSDTQDTPSSRV